MFNVDSQMESLSAVGEFIIFCWAWYSTIAPSEPNERIWSFNWGAISSINVWCNLVISSALSDPLFGSNAITTGGNFGNGI